MKVLIISHAADIDGVTPIILGNLVWDKDLNYVLCEVNEIDEIIKEYIEKNKFNLYDKIYITDLSISEDSAKLINNSIYKDKILIFDHHLPSLDLNKYVFSKSLVEDENGKVSGTSLFYKYLLDNYNNDYINSKGMQDFVELVRLNDTWEWKINNVIAARDLASLHAIYGNDMFIDKYTNFFKTNQTFYFDDKEIFLLEMERKKIKDYVDLKAQQMIVGKLLNYKVGFVFAELYRSELGNDLAERFKDLVDFIVIVNVSRSISYRGIKDINLNEVAEIFGGHGHKNAAGSPLPQNLHAEILNVIFKNKWQ